MLNEIDIIVKSVANLYMIHHNDYNEDKLEIFLERIYAALDVNISDDKKIYIWSELTKEVNNLIGC